MGSVPTECYLTILPHDNTRWTYDIMCRNDGHSWNAMSANGPYKTPTEALADAHVTIARIGGILMSGSVYRTDGAYDTRIDGIRPSEYVPSDPGAKRLLEIEKEWTDDLEDN